MVSYNVHGYRGGLEAVAGVLRHAAPDFACVQECGSRREVRRLAGLLGMHAATTHRPFNRVRNAVLCREPWRIAQFIVSDLPRQDRALRRGYLLARIRGHGRRLTVVSTHLGLGGRERERQARELTDVLAGLDRPVILGADLNEDPRGAAARWIADRLLDVWAAAEGGGETFPAGAPTARIDYVFTNDRLRSVGAWVPDGSDAAAASDHRPVVADLQLQG